MRPFAVLEARAGRAVLHELRDGALSGQEYLSASAARAGSDIPPDRILQLNAPPDAEVPTLALPAGHVGAIRQITPLGLLPATMRVLIGGVVRERADWEGIICLPDGEQTLWAHVSAREIVSFQGAASARLAAAFGVPFEGSCDPVAMDDTMSRPERLAVQLNSATLAGNTSAIRGHLIGAELAAMRPYWLGQKVVIVAEASPYAEALSRLGVEVRIARRAETWHTGLLALGRAAGMAG